MFTRFFCILITLIAIAPFGATVPAQCSWDAGGAVAFTINGVDPATDPLHQVPVSTPYTVSLDFTTPGGTRSFVFLAGVSAQCGALPIPWGGSVDLGGAVILGDGLSPQVGIDFLCVAPVTFAFTAPSNWAGGHGPGFQAINTEPANPPFFLDNSVAGEPVYLSGTTTTYSLGDDDSIAHVSGVPMTFGGVAYTTIFVGSNGQITFGTQNTDFTESLTELFAGFQTTPTFNPNPGVAVAWTDLNRGGLSSGATYEVFEDTVTQSVKVSYLNQNHWSSQDPAGNFSVEFGGVAPGSVSLDHTGFIPGLTSGDDIVIGVTDGDDAVGSDNSADLSALQASSYVTTFGPESIGELFGANQPLDFGVISFFDLGDGNFTPWFTWSVF